MELLGIGPMELLLIVVILLVVVGPRNLSKSAHDIGRFLNRMYRSDTWRMMTEASRTLRNLPNQLAREAALEELDATQKELRKAGREIRGQSQEMKEGMSAWVKPPEAKPKPEKPPTQPVSEPVQDSDASQDEDTND